MAENRSEFFAKLNAYRDNFQKDGRVEVDTENSLPSLAYLNTDLPTTQYDLKDNATKNVYQRLTATLEEFSHTFKRGILDVADGIFDFAVNTASPLIDSFGSDGTALDIANYNWQDRVLYTMEELADLIHFDESSDIASGDWWEKVSSDSLLQEHYAQISRDSFTSELGEKGQNFVLGVYSTLGQLLPSIVAPQTGIANAGRVVLGVNSVSALGRKQTEVLNEGGSYLQALGSGSISAGIEIMTEHLPFSKNMGGVVGKGTSKTLQKVLQSSIEEGVEEAVSELLSPIADLPYKGESALDPYKFWENPEQTVELLKNAGFSGTMGAIGGGISANIQLKSFQAKYGKSGINLMNNLTEAQELINENNKLATKDLKANSVKIDQNQARINELLKKSATDLKTLKSTDTKAYDNIMQVLMNPSEALKQNTEEYTKAKENLFNDMIPMLQEQADVYNNVGKLVTKQLGKKANMDLSFRLATETEMQENGNATAFYDPSTKEIVVGENYRDLIYEKIAHEAISHAILDNDTETKQKLLNNIKGTKLELDLERAKAQAKELGYADVESEGLAILIESNLTKPKQLAKVIVGSESLLEKAMSFITKKFSKSDLLTSEISKLLNEAKAETDTRLEKQYSKKAIGTTEQSQEKKKADNKPKTSLDKAKTKLGVQEKTPNRKQLIRAFVGLSKDNVLSSSVTSRVVNDLKNQLRKVVKSQNAEIVFSQELNGTNLWEILNLSEKKQNYDKYLDKFIDEILNAKVKNPELGISMTLKQIIGEDIANDFKQATLKEIKPILNDTKHLTTKARYEKMIAKIYDRLNKRVAYYRNVASLTFKTYKNTQRIIDKVESRKIKNVLSGNPKAQAIVGGIIKSVKALQPSRTYKTYTPSAVAKLVNFLNTTNDTNKIVNLDYNYENLQDNDLNNSYFIYDDNIQGIVEHFKGRLSQETDTNGKSYWLFNGKQSLDLEEMVMLNQLVGYLNHTVNNLISEERASSLVRNYQTSREFDIVVEEAYANPSKFANTKLHNFINDNISFGHILGNLFSYQGNMYKLLFTDVQRANNKKQADYVRFLNQYSKAMEDNNITEKHLTEVVDFKGNKMTYNNLFELYAISLSEKGLMTISYNEDRPSNKIGGYKYDYKGISNTIKLSEQDLVDLKEMLSDNEIAFVEKVVKDLYNGELQEYKRNADLEVKGYQDIQEGTYYPQNRTNLDSLSDDHAKLSVLSIDPSNRSNLKESKNRFNIAYAGIGLTARYGSYVDVLSSYANTTLALNNMAQFLNQWTEIDGKKQSRLAHLNNAFGSKEILGQKGQPFKWYLDAYVQRLKGESNVKLSPSKSNLFGNIIAFQLYGNPSVVLKQTASIPTILTEVSYSSFRKGMARTMALFVGGKKFVLDGVEYSYQQIKKLLSDNSGVLGYRWLDSDYVKSRTGQSTLSKWSKIFGIPMEKMDEAVIVAPAFFSALYEAEAISGHAVGTKANFDVAIDILNQIVLRTQSNSDTTMISTARSGQSGFVVKTLSMFTSDLQNKFQKIVELCTRAKNYERNINRWQQIIAEDNQEIDRLEREIADIPTQLEEESDIDFEKRRSDYETQVENHNITIENLKSNIEKFEETMRKETKAYGDLGRDVRKLLASTFITAMMITLIDQLVDRLKGTSDWKEDTREKAMQTFIVELFAGNIPYVNQLFNSVEYNTNYSPVDFQMINQTVQLMTDIRDVTSGKKPVTKLGFSTFRMVGGLTGIPTTNIYNYAYGTFKQIVPNGYKGDYIMRGMTEKAIYTNYIQAVENGNKKKAKETLEHLLYVYKGGKVSDKAVEEILRLNQDGYNILPSSILTQYTNEKGEVVELTRKQEKDFTKAYFKASESISSVVKSNAYQKLTEEQKAYVIKSIYTNYYAYAKSLVTGIDSNTNISKLLASENFDIAKFMPIYAELRDLSTDENSTKKEKVMSQLSNMNRLSAIEKKLMLLLLGYKLSESETNITYEHYGL